MTPTHGPVTSTAARALRRPWGGGGRGGGRGLPALLGLLALLTMLAALALGASAAEAATINVYKGGDRNTGQNGAATAYLQTLDGAVFEYALYDPGANVAGSPLPTEPRLASAAQINALSWNATTCTIASGTCSFTNVPANTGDTLYVVREKTPPAGWDDLGPIRELTYGGTAFGVNMTTWRYLGTVTLPASGSTGTAIVSPAGNNPTETEGGNANAPNSRQFVDVRDNPLFPLRCGLNVTLLLDRSGSITSQQAQYRAAAKEFIAQLANTGTRVKIASFAEDATWSGGGSGTIYSLDVPANVTSANAAIDAVYNNTGNGTNWDVGMQLAAQVDASFDTELVVFITDGNPTARQPVSSTESSDTTSDVNQLDLAFGIGSANLAKQAGPNGQKILAVGVGSGVTAANLRIVSGPNAFSTNPNDPGATNPDYAAISSATDLAAFLGKVANLQCGARIHVRKLTVGDGQPQPAAGWTIAATGGADPPAGGTITPGSLSTSGTNTDVFLVDRIPAAGWSGITVAETLQSGYVFTAAQCVKAAPPTGNNPPPFPDPVSGGQTTLTLDAVQRQEDWWCTFTNTKKGTVIIDKVTNPSGDPQSFDFTTNLPGGSFSLTDQAAPKSVSVAPGTYSVSETVPAGWDLTSATCSDGSAVNAINVAAGETVTCTFTNTKKGTVIIDKVTNPSGDPQSFDFTTNLPGGSFSLTDQAAPKSVSVAPGTYSVSETVPAGWDLTSATCSDGSAVNAINVAAGETVTCTFTNTKRGSITLIKQTIPDGDPQQFTFTGELAGTIGDGQAIGPKSVAPGSYTATEAAQDGWDLTQISCDDTNSSGNLATRTATFNVAAGEDVTCTFTNTKKGSITIVKATVPGEDPQDFTFDPSANLSADTFVLDTDPGSGTAASKAFTGLAPGTYSVQELATAGWDLTALACAGGASTTTNLDTRTATINLAAGETVTCTFTNTKRGSITLIKQTIPDGDPQQFTFTGELAGTIGDGQAIGPKSVAPGSYTATEAAQDGWDLTQISCDDTNSSGNLATRTATFNVAAGEDVTCTFTNTKRGRIIVTKQTVPDGATQSFDFSASYAQDGFSLTDGQSNTSDPLVPGTYSVSETVPAGWNLTSTVCSDESPVNAIVLGPGETVTCTFTNSRKPRITLVKQLVPASDPGTFDLLVRQGDQVVVSAPGVGDGGGIGPVNLPDAGLYTVTEQGAGGTDLTKYASQLVCTNRNQPNTFAVDTAPIGEGPPVAEVDATYGDDWLCTFTNTRKPGQLELRKALVPASDPGRFTLRIAAGDATLFTTADVGDGGTTGKQQVVPGAYAVSEAAGTGTDLGKYAQALQCRAGGGTGAVVPSPGGVVSVDSNDDVVCTITNTRKPGQIEVRKDLRPDADPGRFTLSITGPGGPVASAPDQGNGGTTGKQSVAPGTYTVAEAAGTSTSAADYTSGLRCVAAGGAGPEVPSTGGQVAVDSGDDLVCVFTNTRNPVPVPPTPPVSPQGQPTTPTTPVTPPVVPVNRVTRARLAIDKRAAGRVTAGQLVRYAITVRNRSRVTAKGVVVTDTIPAQMTLAGRARGVRVSGGTVTWRVGDLRAGRSRTVILELRMDSAARGRRCNVAAARASNAAQVRDRACTRVVPIANRVEPAVTG